MANQSDFMKVLIKDVTMHWPRLDQPYRYNSQEKRTEACAPTVQNAGYSIAWDMPMADAKALFGDLKKHYEATRANNSKLPAFSAVFGMKKDEETGTCRFTAKKRAVSNDGKINKPPIVIGADTAPLEDKAIWSGSKGNIRVLAFAVTDPDGKGGISLLLDVVQVVEAVYGDGGLGDDFAPVSTSKSIGLDDFDGDNGSRAGIDAKPRQPATADADF